MIATWVAMPTNLRVPTIICSLFMTLVWAPLAFAGTITLDFEHHDDRCVVINHGDSSAYYPVMYHLGRNGQWLALQTEPRLAELPPGGTVTALLPPLAATATNHDLDFFQVVLVRFFDQAGVSFGHIVPLRPLPDGGALHVRYGGRLLTLGAPPAKSAISATWVVAPWEEGIAPIFSAQSFTHFQPPAPRIDWQRQQSAEIDIGAAQPAVLLFHETDAGLTLQRVQKRGAKIKQQRTAWLTMRRPFYITAALCGLCGLLLAGYANRVKS